MFAGALAPETYQMVITQSTTGVDCTTISAVTFKVMKPDGSETTWNTSLSGATTSQVTATHTMPAAAPSDVLAQGTYKIYALCTIPSGTVRTDVDYLVVKPHYEKLNTA